MLRQDRLFITLVLCTTLFGCGDAEDASGKTEMDSDRSAAAAPDAPGGGAYPAYVRRAKASQALAVAAPLKLALSEYYLAHQEWPVDAATAGIDLDALRDEFTKSGVRDVSLKRNEIRLTFTDEIAAGGTLTLAGRASSDGNVLHWDCTTNAHAAAFAPAQCR